MTEELEVFHWGPCVWDVARAKAIVAERTWNAQAGVEGWMRIAGVINLDKDWAQQTKPEDEPVIIAQLPGTDAHPEPGTMLIDGWHRLYHGHELGLKILPAHLLTMEESMLCRLDNFQPRKKVRRRPPRPARRR